MKDPEDKTPPIAAPQIESLPDEEFVQLPTHALVSHESAVEAIWALAARNWEGLLGDENIWLVPKPEICVTSQGDFKQLARSVDLEALGIARTPVDLLVPNKACYSRGKLARFHVWSDSFPPHSLVRVHERVFVSTPYFAVIQLAMARRAGHMQRAEAETSAAEDARIRAALGLEGRTSSISELMRWENIARFVRATQVLCDFMGSYRYVPAGTHDSPGIAYHTKPLITPESFANYLTHMRFAKGIERARGVASAAFAGAASPMETALALMLTLPTAMGGYDLPRPEINWEIPVQPEQRELCSQDSITPDLCWPDKQLAVEYYGWEEHFGAGPRKVASDAARANSLSALGWTVLHVTFEQVATLAGMSLLARQIAQLLGIALSSPSELELVWRARLLAFLLPARTLAGEFHEASGRSAQ